MAGGMESDARDDVVEYGGRNQAKYKKVAEALLF
jgi:hypothetical protein